MQIIAASVIETVSFLYGNKMERSVRLKDRLDGLITENMPAIAAKTLRERDSLASGTINCHIHYLENLTL